MPIPELFIACTFSEGMLPSEYSVTIELPGRDLSLFAPKDEVVVKDEAKGVGLLRVRLVDQDHNVIALPAETIGEGRRFIEYPPDRLESL